MFGISEPGQQTDSHGLTTPSPSSITHQYSFRLYKAVSCRIFIWNEMKKIYAFDKKCMDICGSLVHDRVNKSDMKEETTGWQDWGSGS
jgi:hypothetical protein